MDNFRSIDEIPPPYRNIFTEYPCFNAVQSQVLDNILYTDNSVVVSGPTGSGKTAIFELAVIRLLIQYENLDVSQNIKIVYISPIKALCHERLSDWHKKFSPFGLNCVAATGDSDNMDFQQLTNHNLIISTPEKWDSLTRKWRDNEKIVKVVKLFMIDEVHLLNEENRGSTLEVIVCRMKTVENSITYSSDENDIVKQKVRFIAVSATVPNVEDIAEWIGKPSHTKYYRFSEEMRPVKLNKIVYGYNYNPKTTSPFKFDISLNYKLPSLMMQYSEGKPTLIFCSTRKSVEMTANHLVQSLKIHLNEEQSQKLLEVANLITDAKAKTTIRHGVGYHHAGMIPETRHAIENIFRNGDLPVLVTTSTLAMGVNLPAHLVIIKSTKCYDNGGFCDYTETAIHQMIGRAGRPQFDTTATALILTTNEDKQKFEKMVGCGQPIESNLHRHLTEHLNAEIVLGTITDLDVAMQWLSSTFLYVRARKNPHHYGINVSYTEKQIDKRLLEICQIDLNKLVKSGMITIDQNIIITPEVTGKIMAKYYVAFETMKLFTQISGIEILIQILALISKCQEFTSMRLRVNDKKTLNLLNKNSKRNTIRFPLNGKIKTRDMKINCIIQAVLGNLDIIDHSILSESMIIMRNGERITKCLIEYLEMRRTNCYSALLSIIILGKCFHAKLWENSPYVSKQLTGIGSVMSNQLANAGKTTFQKILDSNPRDLELIIKRKPPMGNVLIEEVEHIPVYTMTLKKLGSGRQLELCIILENIDDVREKSTVNIRSTMILLVGSSSNEILVYEKYAHSYMIENEMVQKIIDVNIHCESVSANFISEDWVGIDCNSNIEIQTSDAKKTNKKGENTKSPDTNGRTYVQMFLDMYMKTKKKTAIAEKKECSAKEVITAIAPKLAKNSKTTPRQVGVKTEMEKIATDDKGKNENNENYNDPRHLHLAEVDNAFKESDILKENESLSNDVQVNEPAEDISDACQTSARSEELMNEVDLDLKNNIDKVGQKSGISVISENIKEAEENNEAMEKMNDPAKPNNLNDIQVRVTKAPSLFFISKKYRTNDLQCSTENSQFGNFVSKNKRKVEDVNSAVAFENSLYKEDARKRQKLDEFKFPAKKKFSHKSETDNLPDSTRNSENYTITAILEPKEKQEYSANQNECESDIENPSKERNKGNIQKSITWRSPLVSSPAVKFSPKIKLEMEVQNETHNETFETSTSSKSNTNLMENIQKTHRHNENSANFNYIHKNRGTRFPLRDRDYGSISSNEQQSDDVFEMCSSSFLEKLGFLNNQHKSTSKFKKVRPSPTLNYYSQLLSQPIQAQKQKTHTVPQRMSEEDKNVKNNNNENKENFSNNTDFVKTEPNEIRRPKLESELDIKDSPPFVRYISLQQMLPSGEQKLKDISFNTQDRQVLQNKSNLYSNVEYIPETDINRGYFPRSTQYFPERYPNTCMVGNYENIYFPNYSCQDCQGRSSNLVHDQHRGLIKDISSTISYDERFAPYNYCDYPKVSQRYRLNENICNRIHQNDENISPSVNRDFERKSIALNQSQILDDCNNEDFHQVRQYSQYFQKDSTRMDSSCYQPVLRIKSGRDYRIDNSQIESVPQSNQKKYCHMQDLNRPDCCPQRNFEESVTFQSPPYIQRKSFEEKMNEENNLRNTENFSRTPMLNREVSQKQNFMQDCDSRPHPRFVQKDLLWPYHEEYSKYPRGSSLDMFHPSGFINKSIPQNGFENPPNDNLAKKLNRSLSFEEKSNFTEQNFNLTQNPEQSERICRTRRCNNNDVFCPRNSCFPQTWDIQEQNFWYQNDFRHQQNLNANRTFTVPPRVCYLEESYRMPFNNEEMETFPINNDKEYMMNKFLFSLNEK